MEPGFAQLFQRFGRRLNYRGRDGVDTEIKLLGAVHNLSKLFDHKARTSSLKPPPESVSVGRRWQSRLRPLAPAAGSPTPRRTIALVKTQGHV
ncbi:hypothetical protein GCM10010271_72400 [Streptomyces kurssanovii]|nr:hypothetical protein GCM10010271_72400 [Streptomyces kurssanovii]